MLFRLSGQVSGSPILYWDHRKGPGGPPGEATCPGGHMGCRGCALAYMGQGHQPQEAHAPRVQEGRSPKGGRHLLGALGRRDSFPWPHPPRRLDLLGPAPPPLALLYILGRWRTSYLDLWCIPLPLQHLLLLHSAWRSPAGVLQLHHHHAVMQIGRASCRERV